MIAELGHFALVLALGLALVQATVPMFGARTHDPVLMGVAGPTALMQFAFVAFAFAALTACYVNSDFSAAQCVPEFPFVAARRLQVDRGVGEPRGLDAALGPHSCAVRRAGRSLRQ